MAEFAMGFVSGAGLLLAAFAIVMAVKHARDERQFARLEARILRDIENEAASLRLN